MKIFRKKDIKRMALAESKKRKKIFEDESEKKAYVDGSGTLGDISKRVNDTFNKNSNSNSAIVPVSNYNGKSGDNIPTVKVDNNKSETISKAINNIKPGTNFNLEVPRENESIDYLRDNSVSFTKREIREMFKR